MQNSAGREERVLRSDPGDTVRQLERDEDELDAALEEACRHDPALGLRVTPLGARLGRAEDFSPAAAGSSGCSWPVGCTNPIASLE